MTKHVFRMSKQYLANVALKINVKIQAPRLQLLLLPKIGLRLPSMWAWFVHKPIAKNLFKIYLRDGIEAKCLAACFCFWRILVPSGNSSHHSIEQLGKNHSESSSTGMVSVKDSLSSSTL